MGVPHLDSGPMRAEEFFAFTATRPDDEKWELIEGEPVLNASASRLHQKIVGNIFSRSTELSAKRRCVGGHARALACACRKSAFPFLTC